MHTSSIQSAKRNVLNGFACLLLMLTAASCQAQYGGLGGGGFSSGSSSGSSGWWWGGRRTDEAATFPETTLSLDAALNAIHVKGSAQRTLKPESIRLVVAFVSAGATAEDTQKDIRDRISAVRSAWQKALKSQEEDVVEDYISILPIEPSYLRRSASSSNSERPKYRLQINLHLQVDNEKQAQQAIQLAVEKGDGNFVTLDHWSSKLDDVKKEVMAEALKEAQSKSKLLLSVFPTPPPIINITETTRAYSPSALYETYSNYIETHNDRYSSDNKSASKLSFLRGLQQDPDQRSHEQLMAPQIVVSSQVVLYYQSPAKRKLDSVTGRRGSETAPARRSNFEDEPYR